MFCPLRRGVGATPVCLRSAAGGRAGTQLCCRSPRHTRTIQGGTQSDMLLLHVAQDTGKEDTRLWNPEGFFGYASAQSLEHAFLGDVSGRPGDGGHFVLVETAPRVLALGFQYHEDGGPDERPPIIELFSKTLRSWG